MLRRNSSDTSLNAQDADGQLPTELCDPITYEPYQHPVLANDGRIYEKSTIAKHLEKDNRSPFTRKPLEFKEIDPQIIKKFRDITDECRELIIYHKKSNDKKDEEIKLLHQKIRDLEKASQTQQLFNLKSQIQKLETTKTHLEFALKNTSSILSMPPGSFHQSFINSRYIQSVKDFSITGINLYLKLGANVHAVDQNTNESAVDIVLKKRSQENVKVADEILRLLETHQTSLTKNSIFAQSAVQKNNHEMLRAKL